MACLQGLQQLGLTPQQRQRIAGGCKVFRELLTPILEERQQLQSQQQQRQRRQHNSDNQGSSAQLVRQQQHASSFGKYSQPSSSPAAPSYNAWTATHVQFAAAAAANAAAAPAAAAAAAELRSASASGGCSSASADACATDCSSNSSSNPPSIGAWQTGESVLGNILEQQQRVARLTLLMQKV
jgi:hypothetical protein